MASWIKVPIAKLWSPDEPHLYDLRVTAGDDVVTSYVGLRKIEVSPDEKGVPRIKLNGKPIMQVGPLDQGWWPDGLYTPPTDDALKFDVVETKKLGFNCLRKHVKVEPQRFYYHCDKLGILVWQDMPNAMTKEGGEWQQQFEKELTALVEQHINSPSIVMWVPMNEGWAQEPYGKEGTRKLVDLVKKLDPTRLVNNASGWTDAQAGDVYDIHSYPGPAAPAIEKKRAIVLGEFGGLGLPTEGHLWQKEKNWGYANMASKDELTDRYVRLLGRLWQLSDDKGLCAGIYTQTTDVEGEVNGLFTYDREVLKIDASRVREANLGKGPRIDVATLIPTRARNRSSGSTPRRRRPMAGTRSASTIRSGRSARAASAPTARRIRPSTPRGTRRTSGCDGKLSCRKTRSTTPSCSSITTRRARSTSTASAPPDCASSPATTSNSASATRPAPPSSPAKTSSPST
jgi:hypothetical protein